MRIRRLAVLLPLTGVLVAATAAGPAFAAGHQVTRPTTPAAKTVAHGKPSAPPAKPTSRPSGKPTHPGTPFAVTGRLTAVDVTTGTVTISVKGSRNARGTTLTVAVARTARINLDDTPSSLSALPVGAHVAVMGTLSGTARTATRINADDPDAKRSPSTSAGPSASPA